MDMNNLKVSIIMPAYNTEKYISEAIQSIFKQSYSNWELIIVDDGSTDDTLRIIKESSSLDDRILYLSQRNSGQSSARNAGLELASGDMVMFLDSDDMFVGINVFSTCINLISNGCEMVAFNSLWLPRTSRKNKTLSALQKVKKSQYCLTTPIYPSDSQIITVPDNKYAASFSNVCFGCFRRDIIENNNLRFMKGLIFEDWDFMVVYSSFCRKINFINEPFYCYRDNPTSSTKKMGVKVFDVFTIYSSLSEKLMARGLWNQYEEISSLKLMSSLPSFYENMRITISDPSIVNDYINRAHNLLRNLPDETFRKNLMISGNSDFLVWVRNGEVRNHEEFDKKRKKLKVLKWFLALPVVSHGIRLIPDKFKKNVRHFLLKVF